ncbi:hypothetical protein E2C01_047761 [Portunus trituberculatus]|uniref:Uncharacterized protein n=1 Tax=Portunus trituberculatus TaxID=210409 RepID=A0A5B7G9Q1_PORTR|nr:hypothetical protein [Portunus trituberculatus]
MVWEDGGSSRLWCSLRQPSSQPNQAKSNQAPLILPHEVTNAKASRAKEGQQRAAEIRTRYVVSWELRT